MAIRTFKPYTPSRRHMTTLDNSDITVSKPEKSLTEKLKRCAGHNNVGRITSRFRRAGNKKSYRIIDFRRLKDGIPAKVATIEYDPYRTARIALLHYADGEKRYILAPHGLTVGQTVQSGIEAEVRVGNTLPLKNIPVGTTIHAVELQPGKGAQLGRSAGALIQLVAREGEWATVKLPSGEVRRINTRCRATIGQVGNLDHENVTVGKAGRQFHKGMRPHNRGTSMNPVDHPMGGGQGKTSGGRHPCSPWGQKSKGLKTRKKSNPTNKFIISRRKK